MRVDGVDVALLLFVAVAASAVYVLWLGMLVVSSGWILVPGILIGTALLVATVLMWRIAIDAVFKYFN